MRITNFIRNIGLVASNYSAMRDCLIIVSQHCYGLFIYRFEVGLFPAIMLLDTQGFRLQYSNWNLNVF